MKRKVLHFNLKQAIEITHYVSPNFKYKSTVLAPRATTLTTIAPKLRAKGAGDVVKLLLADDVVPGSWSSPKLSARGARRLFDRLGELDAVRELSGRPTFRLYGL